MTAPLGGHPPLVLIANDQEWSSRSLESILAPHGYAVLKAYTGRQAIDLCRTVPVDVVIAESMLSDMSGIQLCERLRRDTLLGAAIPLVMTASGPDGREERIDAHRAGVWEYCAQPFDAEILLLKLENFVRAKREVDRARENSMVDEATGLYSARGLSRRAREISAEAYRRRMPVACIAVGIEASNGFTPGADSEEVVNQRASYLGNLFRRAGRLSDAIGRVGQAEFGIIAPATEATGAVRLVERLRTLAETAGDAAPEGAAHFRLRAGYHAVDDIANSALDVEAILVRALSALRRGRTSGGTVAVTAFSDAETV